MIKEKCLKNIKSQKGITAADVVIAASIVIFIMAIVVMIYVNTTLESRNVTRTAGATRIATNILENIEEYTYEEFNNELTTFFTTYPAINTPGVYFGYSEVPGGSGVEIFSTKIPKGYTVYMNFENDYGDKNIILAPVEDSEAVKNEKRKAQFDLVKKIEIQITYNVGEIEQKVEFETIKSREIVDEANKPETELLKSELKNNIKMYPIRYIESSKAYVKTDVNNELWYNYANKEWATVVLSNRPETELFDRNGKFIESTLSDPDATKITKRYVWIPGFYTKSGEFAVFSYMNCSEENEGNIIFSKELNSNYNVPPNPSPTLTINTYKNVTLATEGLEKDTDDKFDAAKGLWVNIDGAENVKASIEAIKASKILNESKYGPYCLVQ